MKKTDDKYTEYDNLEDRIKGKDRYHKNYKVSGKSIFNLEKIIKDKSQDEQKS